MSKQCWKCHAIMADDALFCGYCGTRYDVLSNGKLQYQIDFKNALMDNNYSLAFWLGEVRRQEISGHEPRSYDEYQNSDSINSIFEAEYNILMAREEYDIACEVSSIVDDQFKVADKLIEQVELERKAEKKINWGGIALITLAAVAAAFCQPSTPSLSDDNDDNDDNDDEEYW